MPLEKQMKELKGSIRRASLGLRPWKVNCKFRVGGGGGGVSKTTVFRGKYVHVAKLKLSEGNLSWEGYGYFLEQYILLDDLYLVNAILSVLSIVATAGDVNLTFTASSVGLRASKSRKSSLKATT